MSLPATSDSQLVTSTLRVSVVIPTHNPRMDYLARVIDALRQQTLACEQWEIVVVDNNSQLRLRVVGPKDSRSEAEPQIAPRQTARGVAEGNVRGWKSRKVASPAQSEHR